MDLRTHPYMEMVKRTSLRPNPKNPRKHSPSQIERLARSIDRFGFIDPVITDDDGLIVAGHGPWLAAGLRNLEDVPAIRIRFMTEADRRAFAVAAKTATALAGSGNSSAKGHRHARLVPSASRGRRIQRLS